MAKGGGEMPAHTCIGHEMKLFMDLVVRSRLGFPVGRPVVRQMFIVRHSTPLRQDSQPTWPHREAAQLMVMGLAVRRWIVGIRK
jgi:hypothetical protein